MKRSLFLRSASAASVALSFSTNCVVQGARIGAWSKQQVAFVPCRRVSRSQPIHSPSSTHLRFISATGMHSTSSSHQVGTETSCSEWKDVLPFQDGSHNSARIRVPDASNPDDEMWQRTTFQTCLKDTISVLQKLEKSSVWVEVPMSRASLIEEMGDLGFRFHHAYGNTAQLNLWLKDSESMVPEFATTNVGVGAVVVNSRDEILCVRELRNNYRPWKIPGGLSELGEHISEAAEREVLEETGIAATFQNILCFRHTHGMANGRSDLYFVCRLDPVEEVDEEGNSSIPNPIAQENEIEKAEWIPLSEYKDMVYGRDGNAAHPMMSHVMDLYDQNLKLKRTEITSVVPGRKPNPIYHPPAP